jgi:hypothetical protein
MGPTYGGRAAVILAAGLLCEPGPAAAGAPARLAGWELWAKLVAEFPPDLAPAAAEKLWPARTGGSCRARDERFVACTAPAPAPGMRELEMELDRRHRVVSHLGAYTAREGPAPRWTDVVKLLPQKKSKPSLAREGGIRTIRIDVPLGLYVVHARPSGALMSVSRRYDASIAARDPSVRIDCRASLFPAARAGVSAPVRQSRRETTQRVVPPVGTALDVLCRDDSSLEVRFHVDGPAPSPGRAALYAAAARAIESSLKEARYARAWVSMVAVIQDDLLLDPRFDASSNDQFVGFPFGQFLVGPVERDAHAGALVLRWLAGDDGCGHCAH